MANKDYTVVGPDGKEHVINGPDNATDEEVIAKAKELFGGSTPSSAPPSGADFSAARGKFDDASGGAVSRAVNSFIDTGKGMVSGLYHSFTDPATPEENKQFGNQPGPIELGLKRTLVDPSVENFRKFQNAPNLSGKIGYGLGVIPVAGPMGTSLGETAYTKGLPEAIGQAGMYVAAPKVIDTTMNAAGAAADATGAAVNRATTPESIKALADKARAYRQANPIGQDLTNIDLTKPATLVRPGAAAGAAVAAPVLNALAERVARAKEALNTMTTPPHPLASEPSPTSSAISESVTHRPLAPAELPVSQLPLNTVAPEAPPLEQSVSHRPLTAAELPVSQLPLNTVAPEAPPLEQSVSHRPLMAAELPVSQLPIDQPAIQPAVPPHIQAIADKLIRRGVGVSGADNAITVAAHLYNLMPELEHLSDIPDASGVAPFDAAVTNRLNTVGLKINAKLRGVAAKQVGTESSAASLDLIADDAAKVGDKASYTKAHDLAEQLRKDGGLSTGETIRTMRQNLINKFPKITSGFGQQVYSVFKGLTETLDPELKTLNSEYYTIKNGAELGKIRTGGTTPESQIGTGVRPKANFKDAQRVQAAKEALKKRAK